MKIKEIMQKKVITASIDTHLNEILTLMAKNKIKFVVVENEGYPVGVINDYDLILLFEKGITFSTDVYKVMKKYVVTIDEDFDISEASDMMGYLQIKHLVVVDKNGLLKGLISLSLLASIPATEDSAFDVFQEISCAKARKTDNENQKITISAYMI